MRALVQRVSSAQVDVENQTVGKIGKGLCVLIGICPDDTEQDINWMAKKLSGLRIFEDDAGKMNLNINQIGGEFLIVSQFTLYADCTKGCRPCFLGGGDIQEAHQKYDLFLEKLRQSGIHVESGIFQADMTVSLKNEGPATFHIESPAKKAVNLPKQKPTAEQKFDKESELLRRNLLLRKQQKEEMSHGKA